MRAAYDRTCTFFSGPAFGIPLHVIAAGVACRRVYQSEVLGWDPMSLLRECWITSQFSSTVSYWSPILGGSNYGTNFSFHGQVQFDDEAVPTWYVLNAWKVVPVHGPLYFRHDLARLPYPL